MSEQREHDSNRLDWYDSGAFTYAAGVDRAAGGHFSHALDSDRSWSVVCINWGTEGPAAVPQLSASTTPGQPATIHLLGCGAEDRPGKVRVCSLGMPGHGSALVDAEGVITYTPDAGFTGIDRFACAVRDGGGRLGTAAIIVAVGPAR